MQTTKYPERLAVNPAVDAGGVFTGKAWISPCATAGVQEWLVNGTLYCIAQVAGHGYTVTKSSLTDYLEPEDRAYIQIIDQKYAYK